MVILLTVVLLVLGALLFGKSRSSHWLETAFQEEVEKIRLASDMQAKLLAAAEAEKSAVMADTDEASRAFADQAREASAALEKSRLELGRLIKIGESPQEMDRFNEFSTCWEKYQEVDREVLDLAVQNTNLKASRLSFAPAREALDRMEAALDKLVDTSGSSPDAAAVVRSASRALTGAVKIHALEAQHIAEASDEEMSKIEAVMKALDAQVNEGLNGLRASTGEAGRAAVDDAQAAYAEFQRINAQVLDLSRQNSNVRSFTMSLGQKRKLIAQCQDLLSGLQDALRSTRFRATR